LCNSRFGWPANKTLDVAQELYDGEGKKIITYPSAEVRYLVLPERPAGTELLSEAELEALVTRNGLIGTALV